MDIMNGRKISDGLIDNTSNLFAAGLKGLKNNPKRIIPAIMAGIVAPKILGLVFDAGNKTFGVRNFFDENSKKNQVNKSNALLSEIAESLKNKQAPPATGNSSEYSLRPMFRVKKEPIV